MGHNHPPKQLQTASDILIVAGKDPMNGLDHSLIHEAQKFVAGDNVHYVKTWIFCYETSAQHSKRRERYGKLLRDFVSTKRLILAARAEALLARSCSNNLRDVSDALNRVIDDAFQERRENRRCV